jgi:hypothetical protein
MEQYGVKKKCSVNIFPTHSFLNNFYFKKVFLKNLTIEKANEMMKNGELTSLN